MSTRRKKVKAAKESWTDLAGVRDAQWVLPCTAEAYDAMVEQMARAIVPTGCRARSIVDADVFIEKARVRRQLRSIGITRPKTKAHHSQTSVGKT